MTKKKAPLPFFGEEDFIEILLNGGVFRPPGVEEQPEVTLYEWSVMEVQQGEDATRHFLGVWDGIARVSSPIKEFDAGKRIGKTMSGRVYKLAPPLAAQIGNYRDIEYIRTVWLMRAGLGAAEFKDVTDEYRGLQ